MTVPIRSVPELGPLLGRMASPALVASAALVSANPASSPTDGAHTGMSDHGATDCAARNSAGNHTADGAGCGFTI